jgi:bifunctional DNA-binding transcriptional regulator/antitoxin component of YhaV-PrlF toxin-antitoxin module
MPTEETPGESKLDDDYTLRLPEQVRDRLDVQPGDKIRWTVTEDGDLSIEVIEQEYGAFEDAPVISLGGAANDHDCMGLDY